MAITTAAQIEELLSSRTTSQKLLFSKTSTLGAVTGGTTSYWYAAGNPAPPSAPTTPSACVRTTPGALFYNTKDGKNIHVARFTISVATAISLELHDRLVHMGGLSGTSTSVQTVNLSIDALADSTNNLAVRKGKSDNSSVQWWIEISSALGATATTLTVTYVNQNDVSSTIVVPIAVSEKIHRLLPLIPTIEGDYIKSVTDAQLAASTGSVGNFGVIATVQRTVAAGTVANSATVYEWTQTGLAAIHNNSCLFLMTSASSTIIQAMSGSIMLIEG